MNWFRNSIGNSLRAVAAVLLSALLCLANSASLELEVKAAMIYNFTKFVDWPAKTYPSPNAPFLIAVIGSEPMKQVLDLLLQEKTVNGHAIHVVKADAPGALKSAQMIFISKSEKKRMQELTAALKGTHALTVSEVDGFAQSGGIIGLVQADGKVRFEVNVSAAQQAGLTISSKLLRLASATY